MDTAIRRPVEDFKYENGHFGSGSLLFRFNGSRSRFKVSDVTASFERNDPASQRTNQSAERCQSCAEFVGYVPVRSRAGTYNVRSALRFALFGWIVRILRLWLLRPERVLRGQLRLALLGWFVRLLRSRQLRPLGVLLRKLRLKIFRRQLRLLRRRYL